MAETYDPSQIIEVLQTSLYGDDMLGERMPVIAGPRQDMLIVTLPNGQRFALVAHEVLDFVEVEPKRKPRRPRKRVRFAYPQGATS
jgi:hypothetical protein